MSIGSPYAAEVSALIHRISELPAAERLRVFAWQRQNEALEDVPISAEDERLVERDAALEAIREFARRHCSSGKWPTAREFDDSSNAIPGWNSRRVAKVWGRWLFAIERLNGSRARLTPEQQAARRKAAGRKSSYESPLEALRQWLATAPEIVVDDAFDRWVRVMNARPGVSRLMPGSTVVRDRLVVPFVEAVRVARGEIELSEAKLSGTTEKKTWSDGPHEFLGCPDIARALGVTLTHVYALARRPDFPLPVIVLGPTRAWLSTDIEAYRHGRPFPPQTRDDLRRLYLSVRELADLLHVTPNAVRQPGSEAPKPIGAICGKHIWYRPDVERWLKKNPPSPYSGRARHERAQASAAVSGFRCAASRWDETE